MPISVTFLKGIKGARAAMLAALGVTTLEDLALLLPRGYEDRTQNRGICEAVPEEEITVTARILRMDYRQIRSNLSVLNLRISDGTGEMTVTFYNAKYIRSRFEKGAIIRFYGKVTKGYYGLELCNPAFTEKAEDRQFSKIQPIYPLTKGLSQNVLRKMVRDSLQILPPFPETLPEAILQAQNLMNRDQAIRTLHAPETLAHAEEARRRLAFEELFTLQLMLMLLRSSYGVKEGGIAFAPTPKTRQLIESLPFRLTPSQEKVWTEIRADMAKAKPMNRLVLGDVGSGKTVLALLAMTEAMGNGYQAVYMAPTEILAEQHFTKISRLLTPLGFRTALLTGSLTATQRRELLDEIREGRVHCIIGTHALIQKDVVFRRPGIVITDEQHRFGVRQRAILSEQPTQPDILVMTATPIPRTLGLILYGDMDISRIDALPTGRIPIRTFVEGDARRERVYRWTCQLVQEGRQVYIVHPLVEDTEDGENRNLISAAQNYEKLSQSFFRDIPCALIHGRMPAKEKEEIMGRFVRREIKILFSTTVIEVGVDVPNAALMIIENAERFGLAQLHQLRGRVGRGPYPSFCVLFTACSVSANPGPDDIVSQRMNIMKSTTDGFLIAEKDLEIRGPGDFFGTQQHGLPQFKTANLYQDTEILHAAQQAAQTVLANPGQYQVYLDTVRALIPKTIPL